MKQNVDFAADAEQAALLPDVAAHRASHAGALDWVGMRRIALPLRMPDGDGGVLQVPAQADVFVDLRDADARGIHMSRLYLRLQQALGNAAPSPKMLQQVLRQCIDSQQGLAARARLRLAYAHLLSRPALVSEHRGWKSYPVVIDAQLDASDTLQLDLHIQLEYSSTCPASAALSRQVNAEAFLQAFGTEQTLEPARVAQWLRDERGMAATPHAQRSLASVRVRRRNDAGDDMPTTGLIDAIEQALGTPVQTAVKREDEQAFARNNAANLMFCEDAARRIARSLRGFAGITEYEIEAAHLESLHAHDAVARVTGKVLG